MTIEVPWVNLPETKFVQLKNGTKGVVFEISSEYVAKVLYSGEEGTYSLRNDEKSLIELTYEEEINARLYKLGIGNVPKASSVEKLKIYDTVFPAYIMEYIKLPRGDELNFIEMGIATDLAMKEIEKAMDAGILPGQDVLNPANFFYDSEKKKIRIIDFGRWEYDKS